MMNKPCQFCRGLEQYRAFAASLADGGPSAGLLVADLPTSVAVLSLDQYYRGYTLVVAKTHATELFHLGDDESAAFVRDMQRVAHAIAKAFAPRKMNYELLGNTVPHLHWHLVPRYDWDPNPTRPIWEHTHREVMLESSEYETIAAAIRAEMSGE